MPTTTTKRPTNTIPSEVVAAYKRFSSRLSRQSLNPATELFTDVAGLVVAGVLLDLAAPGAATRVVVAALGSAVKIGEDGVTRGAGWVMLSVAGAPTTAVGLPKEVGRISAVFSAADPAGLAYMNKRTASTPPVSNAAIRMRALWSFREDALLVVPQAPSVCPFCIALGADSRAELPVVIFVGRFATESSFTVAAGVWSRCNGSEAASRAPGLDSTGEGFADALGKTPEPVTLERIGARGPVESAAGPVVTAGATIPGELLNAVGPPSNPERDPVINGTKSAAKSAGV